MAKRWLPLLFLVACTPEPTSDLGAGCVFGSDCSDGERCLEGRCVAGAATAERCENDLECPANQRCSALYGECVDGARSCSADAECGDGTYCYLDRSVCSQCNLDVHCAGTSICVEGLCADPIVAACASDSECSPPSTICAATGCVDGCGVAGCGFGETCNLGTGRCEVEQPECTSDVQCGAPARVCDAYACVDGCVIAGCAGSMICNEGTGRCDAAPALLDLDAVCARDGDCASDLCFDFGAGKGQRCVRSCGAPSDCPSGFTCHQHDGASLCVSGVHFSASFDRAVGASCSNDSQCQSDLCEGGQCIERCTAESDCGAQSCRWNEVDFEEWEAQCIVDRGHNVGDTCDFGGDCSTGVCITGGNTSIPRCAELCDKTTDCDIGSICVPVDYSTCVDGSFSNCREWEVQMVKACVSDNHGNKAFGEACTESRECRSYLCAPDTGTCTNTCSVDADCPAHQGCKVDVLFELEEGSSLRPVHFNVCRPRTP
ncbi:MAG: hypothetical protein RMA76_03140 [Deltaproteobacteria bacterium]|jgi:hypothetical protein